jgi:3'-phosphoadenosine 5'-phosphosulfate sulfotransferase (PAPS reductase)/FAD synthetase
MLINETSEQLCQRIADLTPTKEVINSFSMGKDSIASYIQLKRYFKKVYNVFYTMLPQPFSFQRESLDYYEQKFGERIIIVPNPSFYRMLYYAVDQSIDRIYAIDRLCEKELICEYSYDNVFLVVKMAILGYENADAIKTDDDVDRINSLYVGTGVRAADSMTRRISIKKYGAENKKRRQFFPVFDWNIEKVKNEIFASGIKLPVDYKIWGRTFDGFDMRFLKGLREHFPADYAQVKKWFPLIETDWLRYRDFCKFDNEAQRSEFLKIAQLK